MRKREALAIFSLIIALALAGYVLVSSWAMAQENGEDTTTNEEVNEENEADEEEEEEADEEEEEEADEEEEEEEAEEEEVEEAEEQFDNLFKRLEKMELKVERASMSLIITPQRKATLVNVDLETIEEETLTLTVGGFGLTFTVDASDAKIYGGKGKAEFSDLEVGDKLLIKGVVDEETGVIEASRIHDRSVHKKAIENFRAKIQELLRRIEELQARVGVIQGD